MKRVQVLSIIRKGYEEKILQKLAAVSGISHNALKPR